MPISTMLRDADFALGILRKRPFNVLLQVTNRCNMKCSFCDFWPNAAPRGEELSTEDYRRVARELDAMGCFLVSIEGGEPLVRPDLVEIVRALGRKHLPTLFTNGWYVEADNARALFDAGLVHACVSIDFPDAARHDAKRGLPLAFAKAWRAVELLREAAPRGGKQVHVMTVLMRENADALDELLSLSAAAGVGHEITLLSREGFRRGDGGDEWPDAGISSRLLALKRRHPHFRTLGDYLGRFDDFLARAPSMPRCRAGVQGFNVDHLGNVAPCIEKIDRPVGNLRREPLAALLAKMRDLPEVATCQDCWTLCRGFVQTMGQGGTLSGWRDLARARA